MTPRDLPRIIDAQDNTAPLSDSSAQPQLKCQQELQDMLSTLPDKVSYPVMVPFGSVAYFPGRLIHTNECMVDLGTFRRTHLVLDVCLKVTCSREKLQPTI